MEGISLCSFYAGSRHFYLTWQLLFIMVDLMKMEFFICKLLISVVVVVLNYVFSKILIFTGDKKK